MQRFIFNTIQELETFKKTSYHLLEYVQQEVCAIEGVTYSEIWLCVGSPSFICGYNSEDQPILSFPIH